MNIEKLYKQQVKIAHSATDRMIKEIKDKGGKENFLKILGGIAIPTILESFLESMPEGSTKTIYLKMLKDIIGNSRKKILALQDHIQIGKLNVKDSTLVSKYISLHPPLLRKDNPLSLVPEAVKIINEFKDPEKIKQEMKRRVDEKLDKWAKS